VPQLTRCFGVCACREYPERYMERERELRKHDKLVEKVRKEMAKGKDYDTYIMIVTTGRVPEHHQKMLVNIDFAISSYS
jgi:hypothetical protein